MTTTSLKLQVPTKLKPFVTTKKRYKVAYGGRGGAKSMTFADILCQRVQTEGINVGCLREFQNSLDDSVFALLNAEISRLEIPGFKTTLNSIKHKQSGGSFKFRGLARSIEAIKSMFGFKIFWLEEGQFISEDSLKILTPTLREEESELWISANPLNSADPFSQRFIVPFQKELDTHGVYEDEMHYIVKINYRDNPWFPAVLEQERQFDFKTLTRAMYDHIWEGAFNDSVENGLIQADWFDACIDAHKVLGIKPTGIRIASHDPSDEGPDSKSFAFRHGIVVQDVREKEDGDIAAGCDWALDLAITYHVDAFSWDCDGMGIGLKREITKAFEGKHTLLNMFRGSKKVDNPDAVFEPLDQPIQNQVTNKDALINQRAQYYFELRKRVYKTFEAVTKGVYHNPDDLISFSSTIPALHRLRSELCLMPIKPNGSGKFALYTKQEMKDKFKFRSPNLADAVMMLCKVPQRFQISPNVKPKPIKPMGIKTGTR